MTLQTLCRFAAFRTEEEPMAASSIETVVHCACCHMRAVLRSRNSLDCIRESSRSRELATIECRARDRCIYQERSAIELVGTCKGLHNRLILVVPSWLRIFARKENVNSWNRGEAAHHDPEALRTDTILMPNPESLPVIKRNSDTGTCNAAVVRRNHCDRDA